MIVCVCKAVSDRRIRRAAELGVAISLRDLTRELGVGTCCGKCVPAARELLDEVCSRPMLNRQPLEAPVQALSA